MTIQFTHSNTTVANGNYFTNVTGYAVILEGTEIYGVRDGRVYKIIVDDNVAVHVGGKCEQIDLGPVEDYEYGIDSELDEDD